jgi:hypothetical protein
MLKLKKIMSNQLSYLSQLVDHPKNGLLSVKYAIFSRQIVWLIATILSILTIQPQLSYAQNFQTLQNKQVFQTPQIKISLRPAQNIEDQKHIEQLKTLEKTIEWHQSIVQDPRFNLDFIKKSLKQHALNDYLNQQEAVILSAKIFIIEHLKQHSKKAQMPHSLNKKPAVVLDIDETSLSNYSNMMYNDFAYIKQGGCYYPEGICDWSAWKAKAIAPAILPTLELYKWLLDQKIAVFFITGRDTADLAATKKNLIFSGFDVQDNLYLRPIGQFKTVVEYKRKMREDIEEKGYQIIANIGDQHSDLIGGFALRTFKMPNPFYHIQ